MKQKEILKIDIKETKAPLRVEARAPDKADLFEVSIIEDPGAARLVAEKKKWADIALKKVL